MIEAESPYADHVVALIDSPRDGERARVERLRELLGDRLVELPALSLEEYVPERAYEEAGLDKAECLERVRAASKLGRRQIKREISTALAGAMRTEPELLELMPELQEVVRRSTV